MLSIDSEYSKATSTMPPFVERLLGVHWVPSVAGRRQGDANRTGHVSDATSRRRVCPIQKKAMTNEIIPNAGDLAIRKTIVVPCSQQEYRMINLTNSRSRAFAKVAFLSVLVLFALSIVVSQAELQSMLMIIGFVVTSALTLAGIVFWLEKEKPTTIDQSHEGRHEKEPYAVALTFPGEQRPFVHEVAVILSKYLGQSHVFYDKFHSALLARPNLDEYLQIVYRERSSLIVVFLCNERAAFISDSNSVSRPSVKLRSQAIRS